MMVLYLIDESQIEIKKKINSEKNWLEYKNIIGLALLSPQFSDLSNGCCGKSPA